MSGQRPTSCTATCRVQRAEARKHGVRKSVHFHLLDSLERAKQRNRTKRLRFFCAQTDGSAATIRRTKASNALDSQRSCNISRSLPAWRPSIFAQKPNRQFDRGPNAAVSCALSQTQAKTQQNESTEQLCPAFRSRSTQFSAVFWLRRRWMQLCPARD